MKTLIELYDDRPIENVLASEVFKPETTVFLCPGIVAQNKRIKKKLNEFFRHRGLSTKLVFFESSLYDSDKLLKQLKKVTTEYPDCVLDITGGTDAALFACGRLTETTGTPAFTYSRKRKSFFDIHKAHYADGKKCTVTYSVEDCFLMAGGAMRMGRVDNSVLDGYYADLAPFFRIYMEHRSEWNRAVGYIQSVSGTKKGASPRLKVNAPYSAKGERGNFIDAPEEILRELETIGLIKKLSIKRGENVSFSFRDLQIRTWMRDVGSVLELYVYKVCRDTAIFNDVVTSAVVDWEGSFSSDSVTNEIDVMATAGIMPLFISCKTCAVTTEAINELAILRDRFGGEGAKAAIVTTQRCRSITRHRASELDISVIDLVDIKSDGIGKQIVSLMNNVN